MQAKKVHVSLSVKVVGLIFLAVAIFLSIKYSDQGQGEKNIPTAIPDFGK